MKDYYSILGVSRTAEPFIIDAAYKAMSRQWHPDVCKKPQAKEKFQEISEAYSILKNPVNRRAYDKALRQEDRAFKEQKKQQKKQQAQQKKAANGHVNSVNNDYQGPPIDVALTELLGMYVTSKGGEQIGLVCAQPEVKEAARQLIAAGLRKLAGVGQ